MDFAKAFDTVPHHRLIHKLQQAGIRGRVLYWVKSFLSARKQRVVLRNGVSSWLNVTRGVPQGSILGFLLFILYVNDIPESVKSTVKMFADDTKIYQEIKEKEDCERLQMSLNAISAWSRTWLLKFNASKCVVLSIRNKLDYKYTLNDTYLEKVHDQKDLGVIISDDLTPRKHILDITKKAYQRLGLIKRCFTNIRFLMDTLYKTIIRPVLEYGSPVWSPWLKTDIDLLETVQRRCLKYSNSPNLLETLENRRMYVDLCEVYKMLNNMYKNSYLQFFAQPGRSLRGHSKKLAKEYTTCNSDVARKFFSRRVIDEWNVLPEEVIAAPSLSTFKKQLRSLPSGLKG